MAQPSEERLRQQEALLNERLRFMARASALLGSSLDLDDLLDELARLGLPLLGNGCLIDVVLDGRHTRRLGASLLSERERELVERFIDLAKPLEEGRVLRQVLDTKQPMFITEMTEQFYRQMSGGDEELVQIGIDAKLHSFLMVPLLTRGNVIGALAFFVLGTDRRLDESHLEMATELAARAATAIQNAHLYATVRAQLAERERAEAALRESGSRLRSFFDSPSVSLAILDLDEETDDFIWVLPNRVLAAKYGLAPEAMMGRRGEDMGITRERRAAFIAAARRCRDTGETVEMELNLQSTLVPQWVMVNLNRIGDPADGPTLLSYVAIDITERKNLEAQLLQAQKMEAVGRLAGGVAHDFNNLLTVISGSAEFVLLDLENREGVRDDVMEIRRAAQRGANLTRQLLTFSRRQVIRPRDVEVNTVVREAGKLLGRLIGEDIEVVTQLSSNAPVIHMDVGQLEQALVNLAVNARDAMPSGGKLTITTGEVTIDASSTARHAQLVSGHYAMIEVSDTGVGMDATTQARIFEPFFTTKEPGKGTGLGLSTVFGTVTQAGGAVSVDSRPGSGSTFTLYLPAAPSSAQLHTSGEHASPVAGGSETILLVEDDPRVRRVSRRTLEEHGYRVIEASSGAEALMLAESWPAPIDLVVTDVVLPELNGRETAEALEVLRPGIRVLFVSGYTADALLHHRVTESGAPFLEKPFTVEALAGAVRAALDDLA